MVTTMGHHLVLPTFERESCKAGVIVAFVACDLFSKEWRPFKCFVGTFKFHFGHHKAVVVAVELIYLECVFATFHKVARLVYYAAVAQFQQFPGLALGNLLFPLEAAESAVHRRSFDGEIPLVATYPHAGRVATFAAQIALCNAVTAECHCLVAVIGDKEFPLNL